MLSIEKADSESFVDMNSSLNHTNKISCLGTISHLLLFSIVISSGNKSSYTIVTIIPILQSAVYESKFNLTVN